MKKLLYILLFVAFTYNLEATVYHFSQSTGSNGGAGTVGDPFRHPSNFDFSTLVPDDSCLFYRGDRWDSVIVHVQNNNDLYFGYYGESTDKPVITGYVDMGTWTDNGNGTWTATSTSLSTKHRRYMVESEGGYPWIANTLNYLLIDDVPYDIACEPDESGIYYAINSRSTDGITWMTDTDQSWATDTLANAFLIFHPEDWFADNVRAFSNSATQVYFYTSDWQNAVDLDYDNIKYRISNWGADNQGEWTWDRTAQEITLTWPSDPNSLSIMQVAADSVFSFVNCSDITLDGLEFWGGLNSTVKDEASTNFIMKNCKVKYGGSYAVWMDNNSFELDSDTIINCNNNGVIVTDPVYLDINDCFISGMGSRLGGDRDINYYGIAILRRDSGGSILRNRVKHTGYSGIWDFGSRSSAGDTMFIEDNLVQFAGELLTDGGGIHLTTVNNTSGGVNIVRSNIVTNQIENSASSRNSPTTMSVGYYIDAYATNVIMDSNYVDSCNIGYKANGTTYNDIVNNRAVRAVIAGFSAAAPGYGHDGQGSNYMNYKHNAYIGDRETSSAFRYIYGSTFSTLGTNVDSNHYFNPYDETDECIYRLSLWVPSYIGLTAWNSQTGASEWEQYSTYNSDGWTGSDMSGIAEDSYVTPLWNWSSSVRNVDLYDVVLKDMYGTDHSGTWAIPAYSGVAGRYVSGTPDSLDLISFGNADAAAEEYITGQVYATDTIEAEDYDVKYGDPIIYLGGQTQSSPPTYVGDFSGYNDSLKYNNVLFSNEDSISIWVAVASEYDNYVVLAIDSITNPNRDSIYVTNTGGWTTFVEYKMNLSGSYTGLHDVILASRRPNIDKFTFPGETLNATDTLFWQLGTVVDGGTGTEQAYSPCYNDTLINMGVGYYVYYSSVDFSENINTLQVGMTGIILESEVIEVRLDSTTGTLLGTYDLTDYSYCFIEESKISNITGIHNVFVIWKSAYPKFSHIRFYYETLYISSDRNLSGRRFLNNWKISE